MDDLAQAIYEAVWQVMVVKSGRHPGPWAQLPEDIRAAYRAGAAAARKALGPNDGYPDRGAAENAP